MEAATTYADLQRYDGAVVERDRRDTIAPCALQPRDVEVIRDVWRYKFLTTPQLLELHWPGRAEQVGRSRLAKLFAAGHVDRFRPITRTGGSFPWTYQLGKEGHRVLREAGVLEARARWDNRPIYDYRYVLHEVHLNAWVLTWRRLLGPALVSWEGETEFEPPHELRRADLRLDDDRSVEGLRNDTPRLIRPDAVLDIERRDGDGTTFFLIEYDRTRRVDKNFEKFLRYDCFLNWWWPRTRLASCDATPFVVFVCQTSDQLDKFVDVADRELTGHSGIRVRVSAARATSVAITCFSQPSETFMPMRQPRFGYPPSLEDMRGDRLVPRGGCGCPLVRERLRSNLPTTPAGCLFRPPRRRVHQTRWRAARRARTVARRCWQ